MQVQVLFLVGLLARNVAATELCLADGIPSDERKDVTIDGRTTPLTIWQYRWESAMVTQEIFKILAEEMLGLNVEYNGSSMNSINAMYAIAGCASHNSDIGCDAGWLRNLVALEAWEGSNLPIINEFVKTWPDITPVDAGSTGYHSFESIFISSSLLSLAQENNLYLDFYRSYNASRKGGPWDKRTRELYFDSIYNISRDKLKRLNRTRFWTRLEDNYIKFTGDSEGVKYVNGRLRAHSEDENWWFAPACRLQPERCIPVITGGSGWDVLVMMQKAASYQIPIGIAVAVDWDAYVAVPNSHRVLFYWWVPDMAHMRAKPTPVSFPHTDPSAWELGDWRTARKNVRTFKWAHRRLEYDVNEAFVLLTRLSITFQQMEHFLLQMYNEGINATETACRWLNRNVNIWQDWLPNNVHNPCLEGTYQAIGDKNKCLECEPGFYCPPRTAWDAMRKNICRPGTACPKGTAWPLQCSYGEYNSDWGAASCKQCPMGYYGDATGAEKCHRCPRGWHQNEPGSEECKPCPVGTFAPEVGLDACIRCPAIFDIQSVTLSSGSTELTNCVCPADFKMTISEESARECHSCSRLMTSLPGGPDCKLRRGSYFFIVAACSIPALLAISLILFCLYRRRVHKLNDKLLELQVSEAVSSVNTFEFPVVLVCASAFLELGCMRWYEDLRDKGMLLVLDTMDAVQCFRGNGKVYIFFSHQWACWTTPDSQDNIQYNCACMAVRQFIKRYNWCVDDVYVWLDFCSIPQKHRETQMMAINALPMYSSLADLFVIVAPHVKHTNTGELLGPESYGKRVWCRAEQVCHYCRHGREKMWLCSNTSGDESILERVEEHWVKDNFAIFSGDCTCCTLKHKGMQQCDKEFLVKPVLGLLAECFWLKESSEAAADVYSTLLETKNIRKQMFPTMQLYNKEDKLIRKVLFGKSIEFLLRYLGKSPNMEIRQALEDESNRTRAAVSRVETLETLGIPVTEI